MTPHNATFVTPQFSILTPKPREPNLANAGKHIVLHQKEKKTNFMLLVLKSYVKKLVYKYSNGNM